MTAAKSIPSVLTPEARLDRALRILREAQIEIVKAVLDQGNAVSEWVDQHHSPLGRRKHLRLCNEGKLPSKKHGKQVLVKRDDLNAYLEREGLTRGHRIEEDDVVDIVERIERRGKR